MHLLSLAALLVFIGFIAKGAYDLVDESILFSATDISVLRTPLWIPQGLWAFGIAVFVVLIALMLVESLLLVLAGRGTRGRGARCTCAPTRRRRPKRSKRSAADARLRRQGRQP